MLHLGYGYDCLVKSRVFDDILGVGLYIFSELIARWLTIELLEMYIFERLMSRLHNPKKSDMCTQSFNPTSDIAEPYGKAIYRATFPRQLRSPS